jgi:TPR repeat protein
MLVHIGKRAIGEQCCSVMPASKSYDAATKEMLKKRPDAKRGLQLLRRAHARGDARAAYALATWHLFGVHDVEKDYRRAAELLTQAAEQNIPEALYDLAVCYEKGDGVRKSERRAYRLYVRAALWGDKDSVHEVGRCLFYGIGTKRDRRLADIWLARAEALGVS